MFEPKPMREIHAVRRKIHRETKNLSPEEYREYEERESRDTEAFLHSIGYKYVPVEGKPGSKYIVSIDD
jgi:hypothetical protein